MSAYFLENWKDYLSTDDYNYLAQFMMNIKLSQHSHRKDVFYGNEKMILLVGPGGNGKTTLIQQIKEYVGNDQCSYYTMSKDIIYQDEIKPLGIFIECDKEITEKNSRAIINMIKYKQSFIGSANIVTFPGSLLEYCRVIQMNHVFN